MALMLRFPVIRRVLGNYRFYSKSNGGFVDKKFRYEVDNSIINKSFGNDSKDSSKYKDSNQFGFLIDQDNKGRNGSLVIEREDVINDNIQSIYRDDSGELKTGDNATESRLLENTLEGRAFRDQIRMNPLVEKAINKNILSLHIPNNLRRSAANYFIELHQTNLHRPTDTPMEVDAHIASIFVQNYCSIYQSLKELQKRIGIDKFNPQRVLDVGFGPATGIVALNDILGQDYRPQVKDAVILGNIEMQKRAKIILSRQYNEIPLNEYRNEIKNEEEEDDITEGKDLVGEVMTKKIKIVTKLKNKIPASKQYDLIILTHQLLKNKEFFPIQIDENIEHYLNMLAPGGHLVMIERGNPLGFETIARARQVMIRPENFPDEHGKIPRPWLRGSSEKKNNKTNRDIIIEDDVEDEELQFEPEVLRAIQNMNQKDEPKDVDYHIKIIAPCSHHRKCPLQVGKPNYYNYPEYKNLKFCNSQKAIIRPKFSIELKRGKILAAPWQEPTDGIGIKGEGRPGKGRPNGRNFEVANYSYLIAERSPNDPESIKEIEELREKSKDIRYHIGTLGTKETWPRIIVAPRKNKGHVVLNMCAGSGEIEKWIIPKSFSKEIYHDARKSMKGDLWGVEAKTKIKGMGDLRVNKLEEFEKKRIKDLKRSTSHERTKIEEMYQDIVDREGMVENDEEMIQKLSKIHGHDYQIKSKRK
ncbi:hypothetical protein Kpol_1032p93 [Vanderwaltozyma polyspora DSM 70294]|uniref:37S ribosomal protein S22, mitochondrial n=1 Tax=Vanderwaltozyma polyspora (strain ATCC 22028 / DSM 70294 / BCRC 21397 / CBS 2163 / NBRC 10782 / NRRL Y-8283 / UCD 57-17) TaxID=436907 RepID=A7TH44_VANPO|nr:uncharacterized protein Kpol_1032p93 [Vanderwaltozyma polyspora DSM 70294]EDO18496.1 hypothetical protein Kpol_1032p93 [Vanderwaltozyma polyspora DSM 70294]